MNTPPETMLSAFDDAFASMSGARDCFKAELVSREVGTITTITTGIAKVSGLPSVGFEELVKFPGDVFGIAFNVDEDEVGVVLLGDYWQLRAGDEVTRTGRVMDVAVGDELLGRVIDPLGRPLDGKGPVDSSQRLPIERPAALIMDRAPVTVPLQTGLKVIDALIPIGRGQRELILGDRQTGKTAIATDTILNQRGQNVLCVYCAIGQRASAVAKELAPVSVPEQIAILLALTANLFDAVPLDRMIDAEQAVRTAAADIPADTCERLEAAPKLSDEDRSTIVGIAKKALAPFLPKSESKADPKPGAKVEPAAKQQDAAAATKAPPEEKP